MTRQPFEDILGGMFGAGNPFGHQPPFTPDEVRAGESWLAGRCRSFVAGFTHAARADTHHSQDRKLAAFQKVFGPLPDRVALYILTQGG